VAAFEYFDGGNVAAFSFLEKTWTVATDFASIIYANRIRSVISDNVVDPVIQVFDPSAFDEFSSFLVQYVRSVVTRHK
jgi:hypothetical protein